MDIGEGTLGVRTPGLLWFNTRVWWSGMAAGYSRGLNNYHY